MQKAIKEDVLATFEAHREERGAPLEDDRFLDFLMRDPGERRAAFRNSFRGLRRYNAFIDDIQQQYAICFSERDRERDFSLSQFLDRVHALQESRKSSLASLQRQIRSGGEWNLLVAGNVIGFALLAFAHRWPTAVAGLVVALAIMNIAFLWIYWRDRRYKRKLLQKIRDNEGP